MPDAVASGRGWRALDSRTPTERPDAPAFRVTDVMDEEGVHGTVPLDAVRKVVCFVGAPGVPLSADQAALLYRKLNPRWADCLALEVLRAGAEVGLDPHACVLACMEVIAKDLAGGDTIVQTSRIRFEDRPVVLCFATTLGRHGGKVGIFTLDEEIPFG